MSKPAEGLSLEPGEIFFPGVRLHQVQHLTVALDISSLKFFLDLESALQVCESVDGGVNPAIK